MTIIRRRELLKQAGGIVLARSMIASALLGAGRVAHAGTALANAIQIIQGTRSTPGSVLAAGADRLNLPISANRLFFTTSYQLQRYPTSAYPGTFPIIGTSDAEGNSSLAIKMLPPSNFIPGSGSNPSLQILLASDPNYTNYVSYVIPEFTIADGSWRNMMVSVGQIAGNPPRFLITASDVNQSAFGVRFKMGFFTDPLGEAPLASQIPPAVFNFPTFSTGLAGNDRYVLWIGQPITSRVGGFLPADGAFNYLYTSPIKLSNLFLDLTPTQNVNLATTMAQFLAYGGPSSTIVAAVSQAEITTSSAEETVYQLIGSNDPGTAAAAAQRIGATTASIASALTIAASQGATTSVMTALVNARASAGQASSLFSSGLLSEAMDELIGAGTFLQSAASLVNATMAATSIARSVQVNPNTIQIHPGATPPQVYLYGNASVVQQVGTLQYVAGGPGSMYQNFNGTSFFTPYGNLPAQQSPDDSSGVIIEDITITSETP